MKQVRIKLADLFRAKSNEESQKEAGVAEDDGKESTETVTTDRTEEGGEETEESEEESGEETEESEEAPKDSGNGEAQVVEMSAAEFGQLKKDAASWRSAKAELETLRDWKASLDGISGGMAKDDQSTRNGKKGPSVLDTSWNQAAIALAEKVK
ncbi:hypothetical protein GO730_20840 [Spirosoma sp. HMF3257]|uniref:Uncharacterized protein n=1 Tax=Spirosoma telluris TaxID=2183553 RepID=A0A327NMR0_9BACT|nr:hypothetical protein [Spirosoma telluris]RAI75995.1 hypothetical protein HMF3257_20765 [Spirosoma telluris]